MENVITISTDLVNGTATLTVTNSGHLIEKITYTNSNQTLAFSSRVALTIPGSDFLAFLSEIAIFQQVILNNFSSANLFATVPFTSFNNIESNNTTTWTMVTVVDSSPNLIDYTATLAGKTVTLARRTLSQTIEFSEWVDLLAAFLSYQNSVTAFFNL